MEHKTLEEVCCFVTGFSFKSSLFREHGTPICKTTNITDGYISFDSMDCFDISDYKEKLDKFIIRKNDIVIGMSGTIKVGISNNDNICYLNQRVGKFIPNLEVINNKFLYYFLCNTVKNIYENVSGGSVINLSNSDINTLSIPVPPLPIQEEVVRILDAFSELTRELTRELELRKKQYAYYRDRLLSFKDVSGMPERIRKMIAELCPGGVEWKTLGECILKSSNIKWKNESSCFYYIDLSSVNRDTHKITETTKIKSDTAPSRASQIVNQGDILFGTTRPLLNRYCQIPQEYHNQICSTGFCVLRPNISIINERWIYHIISSANFMDYVEKYQQGASYPSISDADVKKYKIPVPPLPVQEEIVRILDRFDALCDDLISGLPAEIAARRKQYEYYRDKLLTFREAKRKEPM
ncbi:MAG: restriction endonuclease subunit S [Desulfovibrionaceae bacterium]|nr:restriction endonuclease subunit S [Desulfovibrionaceae bacterium]